MGPLSPPLPPPACNTWTSCASWRCSSLLYVLYCSCDVCTSPPSAQHRLGKAQASLDELRQLAVQLSAEPRVALLRAYRGIVDLLHQQQQEATAAAATAEDAATAAAAAAEEEATAAAAAASIREEDPEAAAAAAAAAAGGGEAAAMAAAAAAEAGEATACLDLLYAHLRSFARQFRLESTCGAAGGRRWRAR
jgi:hypothetical protein